MEALSRLAKTYKTLQAVFRNLELGQCFAKYICRKHTCLCMCVHVYIYTYIKNNSNRGHRSEDNIFPRIEIFTSLCIVGCFHCLCYPFIYHLIYHYFNFTNNVFVFFTRNIIAITTISTGVYDGSLQ